MSNGLEKSGKESNVSLLMIFLMLSKASCPTLVHFHFIEEEVNFDNGDNRSDL